MEQEKKFTINELVESIRGCDEREIAALVQEMQKTFSEDAGVAGKHGGAQYRQKIQMRDLVNVLIDYAEEELDIVAQAFQEIYPEDREIIEKFLRSAGRVNPGKMLASGAELYRIVSFLTDALYEESTDIPTVYCYSLCDFLDALEQNEIAVSQKLGYVDPALDCSRFEESMASLCEDLVQRLEGNASGTDSETAEIDDAMQVDAADLEGCVIRAPLPIFQKRVDHSGDRYALYFGRLSDGVKLVPIPYKELFGSPEAAVDEYVEGQNLEVVYENWTVCLEEEIPDYSDRLEEEYEKGRQRGYEPESSPPILCLSRLQAGDRNLAGPWQGKLRMTFGTASYYDHRVYRQVLEEQGSAAEQAFLRVLKQGRGVTDFIRRPLWGNSGGGIWIRTKDNYLLMSFRNPEHVLEEAGKLGYSSSGCFDRYLKRTRQGYQGVPYSPDAEHGTPAKNMAHEIIEEIGIPLTEISLNALTVVSLGIDVARFLIQFSYFWDCPFTREEIIGYRSNEASTAMEQQVFFVPFEKDAINRFLQTCEFEPGAAFSLMRIRQKYLEGEAGV